MANNYTQKVENLYKIGDVVEVLSVYTWYKAKIVNGPRDDGKWQVVFHFDKRPSWEKEHSLRVPKPRKQITRILVGGVTHQVDARRLSEKTLQELRRIREETNQLLAQQPVEEGRTDITQLWLAKNDGGDLSHAARWERQIDGARDLSHAAPEDAYEEHSMLLRVVATAGVAYRKEPGGARLPKEKQHVHKPGVGMVGALRTPGVNFGDEVEAVVWQRHPDCTYVQLTNGYWLPMSAADRAGDIVQVLEEVPSREERPVASEESQTLPGGFVAGTQCTKCSGTGQIPGMLYGTNTCDECGGKGAVPGSAVVFSLIARRGTSHKCPGVQLSKGARGFVLRARDSQKRPLVVAFNNGNVKWNMAVHELSREPLAPDAGAIDEPESKANDAPAPIEREDSETPQRPAAAANPSGAEPIEIDAIKARVRAAMSLQLDVDGAPVQYTEDELSDAIFDAIGATSPSAHLERVEVVGPISRRLQERNRSDKVVAAAVCKLNLLRAPQDDTARDDAPQEDACSSDGNAEKLEPATSDMHDVDLDSDSDSGRHRDVYPPPGPESPTPPVQSAPSPTIPPRLVHASEERFRPPLAGALTPDIPIQVHSLAAAAHLNGRHGVTTTWDASMERWNVILASGRKVAVQPANLKRSEQSASAQNIIRNYAYQSNTPPAYHDPPMNPTLASLCAMFPNTDLEVVQLMLETNQGQAERTAEALLKLIGSAVCADAFAKPITWECLQCTFHNDHDSEECQMCGANSATAIHRQLLQLPIQSVGPKGFVTGARVRSKVSLTVTGTKLGDTGTVTGSSTINNRPRVNVRFDNGNQLLMKPADISLFVEPTPEEFSVGERVRSKFEHHKNGVTLSIGDMGTVTGCKDGLVKVLFDQGQQKLELESGSIEKSAEYNLHELVEAKYTNKWFHGADDPRCLNEWYAAKIISESPDDRGRWRVQFDDFATKGWKLPANLRKRRANPPREPRYEPPAILESVGPFRPNEGLGLQLYRGWVMHVTHGNQAFGLGVEENWVIKSVAGFEVNSPETATAAFRAVSDASVTFQIIFQTNGTPHLQSHGLDRDSFLQTYGTCRGPFGPFGWGSEFNKRWNKGTIKLDPMDPITGRTCGVLTRPNCNFRTPVTVENGVLTMAGWQDLPRRDQPSLSLTQDERTALIDADGNLVWSDGETWRPLVESSIEDGDTWDAKHFQKPPLERGEGSFGAFRGHVAADEQVQTPTAVAEVPKLSPPASDVEEDWRPFDNEDAEDANDAQKHEDEMDQKEEPVVQRSQEDQPVAAVPDAKTPGRSEESQETPPIRDFEAQLRAWGFDGYAPAFEEHGYDDMASWRHDLAPLELDAEDWTLLGFSKVGHIRKFKRLVTAMATSQSSAGEGSPHNLRA